MKRVAIHSVPRSGSSWLGSIFDSSPETAYRFQPLFSYSHKGQLDPTSSAEEILRFYDEIRNTTDSFVLQKESVKKGVIPKFGKTKITHTVYKEVRYHYILENILEQDLDIKVIGLVRNPFATINSWLKAPKEFKKELGWKVDEEWRFAPSKNLDKEEEFNGYEKWKEVLILFLRLQKLHPKKFYLLNYEDLINNKIEKVQEIFSFCDLEFLNQTKEFLNNNGKVNDGNAYSVFKNKSNDNGWKNTLPEFIIDEIKADPDFQYLNDIFEWI